MCKSYSLLLFNVSQQQQILYRICNTQEIRRITDTPLFIIYIQHLVAWQIGTLFVVPMMVLRLAIFSIVIRVSRPDLPSHQMLCAYIIIFIEWAVWKQNKNVEILYFSVRMKRYFVEKENGNNCVNGRVSNVLVDVCSILFQSIRTICMWKCDLFVIIRDFPFWMDRKMSCFVHLFRRSFLSKMFFGRIT